MSSGTTTPVDMGSSESESSIARYLVDHPRMVGGLFTILLLLMQVGSVAGKNATVAGP
jgi:hypothetical protein